jgi:hypothetical protein
MNSSHDVTGNRTLAESQPTAPPRAILGYVTVLISSSAVIPRLIPLFVLSKIKPIYFIGLLLLLLVICFDLSRPRFRIRFNPLNITFVQSGFMESEAFDVLHVYPPLDVGLLYLFVLLAVARR